MQTIAIYSQGRKHLLQAVKNAGPPKNPWKSNLSQNEVFRRHENSDPALSLLTLEWLSLGDRNFGRTLEKSLGARFIERLPRLEAERVVSVSSVFQW